MQRFSGKVALVTGAGSCIGQAAAKRLAQEGASVVCADVNAESLDVTVAQIAAQGGVRANCICPGDIQTNMANNVTFPADADFSLLGHNEKKVVVRGPCCGFDLSHGCGEIFLLCCAPGQTVECKKWMPGRLLYCCASLHLLIPRRHLH